LGRGGVRAITKGSLQRKRRGTLEKGQKSEKDPKRKRSTALLRAWGKLERKNRNGGKSLKKIGKRSYTEWPRRGGKGLNLH